METYLFLKDAHNVLRWLVILSAFMVLLRVWSGLLGKTPWTERERKSGLIFTSLLNVQLLLGLALLFTSPIIKGAMANMGAAMKESSLRFFLVEHPFLMLIAVIVAQVGFSMSKRAATDHSKYLKATIAYTVATLLIFLAIPWPFLPYGRPLLPSFIGQ